MNKVSEFRAGVEEKRKRNGVAESVLIQGFESPFWKLLNDELKIRQAEALAVLRTTTPDNAGTAGTFARAQGCLDAIELLQSLAAIYTRKP